MKYLLSIVVCVLLSTSSIAEELNYSYSPRVEAEFKKFFGTDIGKAGEHISGVEIIGEKNSERAKYGMPITLKFDVENVEKVLLLNAGGNSYSYDGLYFKECAAEPVAVFSYIEKTNKYPKKLNVNMKTKCIRHQIVLLLWVQTKNGELYSASFPFNTTTSHF